MRRTLRTTILATALTLVAAGQALAGGPTKDPLIQDPVSYGAGEVCVFPLTIEALDNRAHWLTWPEGTDGSAVIRVGGYYLSRVTNDDTGESLTVKANGPATLVAHSDGALDIFGRGPSLLVFFPGEPYEGLLLTNGYYRAHLSADDVITEAEIRGTITNLCDVLD